MEVSREDYLRTIYSIYEKKDDKTEGIKAIDIANRLKVSRPSVSAMTKKLAKDGLLKADPYSKIFLTEEGKTKARQVTHNHRVIEVFLKDILNLDESEIHDEANRLEHAFSKKAITLLDRYLNNPRYSPDGQKIPHRND